MKKLTAFLIALVLLLSLAACAQEEVLTSHRRADRKIAVKETTEVTEDETQTDESDVDSKRGKFDGQTYENTFLGIGCTLDRQWMYATPEEVEQIMAASGSAMGISGLSDEDVYYDMFAATSEGYQISVTFSKDTYLTKKLSEEELLEASADMLEYYIQSAGYENLQTGIEEFSFLDYDTKVLKVSADAYGRTLCEYIVTFRTQKHIVSITVFAESEEACAQLIDQFYTLS